MAPRSFISRKVLFFRRPLASLWRDPGITEMKWVFDHGWMQHPEMKRFFDRDWMQVPGTAKNGPPKVTSE